MKNLLVIQENEFSVTNSMHPSEMQPLNTHVNKLVTSDVQICFPAPYFNLRAKYSHMPNMSRALLATVSSIYNVYEGVFLKCATK